MPLAPASQDRGFLELAALGSKSVGFALVFGPRTTGNGGLRAEMLVPASDRHEMTTGRILVERAYARPELARGRYGQLTRVGGKADVRGTPPEPADSEPCRAKAPARVADERLRGAGSDRGSVFVRSNGFGTQRCRASHGRIDELGARTKDGDERHGIRCSAELGVGQVP